MHVVIISANRIFVGGGIKNRSIAHNLSSSVHLFHIIRRWLQIPAALLYSLRASSSLARLYNAPHIANRIVAMPAVLARVSEMTDFRLQKALESKSPKNVTNELILTPLCFVFERPIFLVF